MTFHMKIFNSVMTAVCSGGSKCEISYQENVMDCQGLYKQSLDNDIYWTPVKEREWLTKMEFSMKGVEGRDLIPFFVPRFY